jgi:hypothetical protein
MKHITAELEAKIRNQIAFVDDRMAQYMSHRLRIEQETGELPKVEANEAESAAWRRALNWVLKEAGCQ